MSEMSEAPRTGVLEDAGVDVDPPRGPDQASVIDAGLEASPRHSEEFDVVVEDIRTRLASSDTLSYARLEDWLLRRFAIAPLSAGAAVFVALVGVGIRLGLALAATALVGEWTEVPWVRWTVVLAFFALVDVATPLMNRPLDMPSSRAAKRLDRKSSCRDRV